MTTTESAIAKTGEQSVAQLLMDPTFQRQVKLALPRAGVTAERLARTALTEVRRNPKLQQCSRNSLLAAVMDCATYGLEPGPMGFAWIIPYGSEAQFQLGYKGLLALLWRSEQIASIASEVVYQNDDFDWNEGSGAFVKFRRKLDGERGEPVAVFAAITTKTGGNIVRVMSVSDVEAHRDRFSKAKEQSPWKTDFDEMACKTLLKRVAKRAPVSAEVQQAIALDDQIDFGAPATIDVTPPTDEKPSRAASVKDAVKAKAAAAAAAKASEEKDESAESEPTINWKGDPDTPRMTKGHAGQLRAKAQKRATSLELDESAWSTVLACILELGGCNSLDEVADSMFKALAACVEEYELP
jgi:recombination protein RecT